MSKIDQNIEDLIRAGSIDKAQKEIQKLAIINLSRPERLQVAHWARRVGLDQITLRLLHKPVRITKTATQSELAEYSMGLIRQGYYAEALEILAMPSMNDFEKIDLFKSYSYIYQWDYNKARPFLLNYLKRDLTNYERKIVEINLAACDTILNPSLSNHLKRLERLKIECEKVGARRIQSNALELMAQTYIYLKDYKSALHCLAQAETLINLESSFDGAFIKKWRAFAELGQNPNDKGAIQKVIRVREEARKRKIYEVVRDCDFHLGIWNRNRTILQKLYFGTPFPAYRQRILNETNGEFKVETSYLWRLYSSKRPEYWIDLRTGKDENESTVLNPQLHSLRLLSVIASDFYRPIQTSTIFHSLYPNSFFDPYSSPNRIDQALLRLRRSLKLAHLPLIINNQDGLTLESSKEFGLMTYIDYQKHDLEFDKIKNNFINTEFKMSDAMIYLKMPKRTLQALIKKWVDEKKLKVIGLGPKTRYIVIK